MTGTLLLSKGAQRTQTKTKTKIHKTEPDETVLSFVQLFLFFGLSFFVLLKRRHPKDTQDKRTIRGGLRQASTTSKQASKHNTNKQTNFFVCSCHPGMEMNWIRALKWTNKYVSSMFLVPVCFLCVSSMFQVCFKGYVSLCVWFFVEKKNTVKNGYGGSLKVGQAEKLERKQNLQK